MRFHLTVIVLTFSFSAQIVEPQVSVPLGAVPAPPVRVIGLIKVKAGRELAFQELIAEMVSKTKRADRGNIRYEFFRTSPPKAQSLQSARTSADYVFVEEWVDQAAVDAHLKWALPIVETKWKDLTESTEFLRLIPVPN
jgi:quinol monooxygenase YgiN